MVIPNEQKMMHKALTIVKLTGCVQIFRYLHKFKLMYDDHK